MSALVHRANNQLGILRATLAAIVAEDESSQERLTLAGTVLDDLTALIEVTGRLAAPGGAVEASTDLNQLARDLEVLLAPLANVSRVRLDRRTGSGALLVQTGARTRELTSFHLLAGIAFEVLSARASKGGGAPRPLLRLRTGSSRDQAWISIGEQGEEPCELPVLEGLLPPLPLASVRRREMPGASVLRFTFPLVEGTARPSVAGEGPARTDILFVHEPGEEADLVKTVLVETGSRVQSAHVLTLEHLAQLKGASSFEVALVDAVCLTPEVTDAMRSCSVVPERLLVLGRPPAEIESRYVCLRKPIGALRLIECVKALSTRHGGQGKATGT